MNGTNLSVWPANAVEIGNELCSEMARSLDIGDTEKATMWSRQIQSLILVHGNYRGEPVRERWLDLTERLHGGAK